ncbi:unnamed protein product [Amoebophrya sp. A120]|nr:unnamed protein product [Amoebophrya sp. A120]|eukprot:GSA120T00015063001.1
MVSRTTRTSTRTTLAAKHWPQVTRSTSTIMTGLGRAGSCYLALGLCAPSASSSSRSILGACNSPPPALFVFLDIVQTAAFLTTPINHEEKGTPEGAHALRATSDRPHTEPGKEHQHLTCAIVEIQSDRRSSRSKQDQMIFVDAINENIDLKVVIKFMLVLVTRVLLTNLPFVK